MDNEFFWRPVRLRNELTRVTGVIMDRSRFRYLQRIGVIPKAESCDEKGLQLFPLHQVEQIVVAADAAIYRDIPRERGHVIYRRPGMFRVSELKREISRRIGMDFTETQWRTMKKLGIIPEGDMYIPGTITQAWSEQAVEDVIASIHIHVTISGQPLSLADR
jgi:hypothetical protein